MGISTHILNTSTGRPAVDVAVSLDRLAEGRWAHLHKARTDTDGRCKGILPPALAFESGIYRLRFETEPYYLAQLTTGLYPYIDIVFEVEDPSQHYHIPLLLTPNSYTTYRGS